MKKTSIGSWAFVFGLETPTPWGDVIRRVEEMGFDGVELGGFPPHPNPDSLPTKDDRDDWKEQLADLGLECSGLAANFGGLHLIDTNDNSEYLEAFRKNLQFCVDCGIPVIRVDTLQPPTILSTLNYWKALKRLVKTWKICAAEAADKGVRMAWEFEPGFAFNKPSDVLRILNEVGHDNFGVMFDACHGYMVACKGARQPGKKEILPGGVLELAQNLRGKINHIHLIDSDGTLHDGETSTHADFGQGLIDFDKLMSELAKNNVDVDWWTIDLCFRADAWEALEGCKKAVDELNKKYG